MTRIRATCPDCGDVEIYPVEVTLRVDHDDDHLVGDASSYRFVCPDCAAVIAKRATPRIAQLLAAGGVEIDGVDVGDVVEGIAPAHPELPSQGPRLTFDDLLDFHVALQGEAWFEELVSRVR